MTDKELTGAAATAHHKKWERRLCQGFAVQAEAIATIIDGKTYEALGFKSFVSYNNARLPWSARFSYMLRQAHYTLEKLPAEQKSYLSSESQLRPLYGMKTVNQVKVIKAAVKLVNGGRLTPKTIAEVAERTQHWVPRSKLKDKDQGTVDTTIEDFGVAFKIINNRSLGGYDLVEKYGDPFQWPGFADALKLMQDAAEAAP